MQTTIGSIVLRAREQLLDEQSPYRYSDAMLGALAFDALRIVNSMRPETRYKGLVLAEADYPVLNSGTSAADVSAALAIELPVEPKWEVALLYFIVAKALETFSSDAANDARAQYCMGQFNALLKA